MLQLLSPELQQLYQNLEVDFDPLHLCAHVMPILESLEEQENLGQYVPLLKDITLVRLIKQVCVAVGQSGWVKDSNVHFIVW